MFNKFFFRNSCCLRDNVEKYRTAGQSTNDNITRRISCWIPKATNTHTHSSNTYCLSTATMVSRARVIVTLDVHCLV